MPIYSNCECKAGKKIMFEFIQGLNPILQALLATIFTWAMTALGAAGVFLAKNINKKIMDDLLGFAAGIMIAASFWSLLAPAIKMSGGASIPAWFPAAAGFIAGGVFLLAINKLLPHLHRGQSIEEAHGPKTSWHRNTLLFLAVMLHNIPEGLAVGVAFGAVAATGAPVAFAGAVALAVGIGIQNFPEGLAISLPLRRNGMSSLKSFWYGQLSAIAEPVAGVIGAAAVIFAHSILPYALGFAAGAMIFVVADELVPDSQRGNNADMSTMGLMAGFVVMMILEVSF